MHQEPLQTFKLHWRSASETNSLWSPTQCWAIISPASSITSVTGWGFSLCTEPVAHSSYSWLTSKLVTISGRRHQLRTNEYCCSVGDGCDLRDTNQRTHWTYNTSKCPALHFWNHFNINKNKLKEFFISARCSKCMVASGSTCNLWCKPMQKVFPSHQVICSVS